MIEHDEGNVIIKDGDMGVAICSECRDWADFELEEE